MLVDILYLILELKTNVLLLCKYNSIEGSITTCVTLSGTLRTLPPGKGTDSRFLPCLKTGTKTGYTIVPMSCVKCKLK